jgi:NAD(P)-dependent dehydrogenase (short-subunit alcohol dehydrogenase family)
LFGAAEELSDEQIERQIATNLTGSIQLIRAAIARLREQGGGRIVQVSSEGGQIAYPGFSAYHATKWGIEGFVEAVAQEVAAFGIDFMIVEPGPTRTNFGAGLDRAVPLDAYDSTPVRELRRTMDAGYFPFATQAKRSMRCLPRSTVCPRRSGWRSAGPLTRRFVQRWSNASPSWSHRRRSRFP